MPKCFECFKEHEIRNNNKTFEDMMFCSDECAAEWHERTKDWKI